MRQTAGEAQIRIFLDGSEFMTLPSPDSSSKAWQWVGIKAELNSTDPLALSTLTIELVVIGGENTRVAYFDDLCLSFSDSCKPIPAVL